MGDLVVALGLVLVIEGLIWALSPDFGTRLLEAASQLPENTLRTAGAVSVAAGFVLVWLVRG